MIRRLPERTSLSPDPSEAFETLAIGDDQGAEPRPLPRPKQLPASTRAALARLLAAARRPFPPSIAQLATEHLTLFIELRAMKARWPQVADFLFERGLAGPTGKISGDVWRATVSRAIRNQKSTSAASAVEVKPVEAIESSEANRNETSRSLAQQSGADRTSSQRASSRPDGWERSATRRNAPRTSIANQNGAERSAPNETQRNESRESSAKRNAREPAPVVPARVPPELRADGELARIAAFIDKPFRTR